MQHVHHARRFPNRILAAACVLASIGISFGQYTDPYASKVDEQIPRINTMADAGPFHPTWQSLEGYQIPEWYKDAKFGIFIHWGVYSVPAFGNEWYPRRMYMDREDWRGNPFKHHKEKHGDQSIFGYKDFIPKLTASKFDAEAWAQLFEDAGARYVVPVAEHHDGFPMYDCSYTDWSAKKMGPKRDIVGELEKTVRAHGMHFGVSSHRAFNWAYFPRAEGFDNADPKNFGLYGVPNEFHFSDDIKNHRNPWPPHSEEFKDNWLARTCELVDKYQPDLVWFDFGIAPRTTAKSHDDNAFADHLKKFTSYYYNWAAKNNRESVINYKFMAYPEKAAVLDLERSKLDRIRDLFWQTDTAVSKTSWGYVEDHAYKDVDRIVDDLVDIVSKNGCLLLNVGPRPDGSIPVKEQEMLRTIGAWLKVNGEAIYESRPFAIYGEGPTGTATGHVSEGKNAPFMHEDFRFTTKGDDLYVFGLKWPADGKIAVKSLGKDSKHLTAPIKNVSMLGSDATVGWSQEDGQLVATLPGEARELAYVLKVER